MAHQLWTRRNKNQGQTDSQTLHYDPRLHRHGLPSGMFDEMHRDVLSIKSISPWKFEAEDSEALNGSVVFDYDHGRSSLKLVSKPEECKMEMDSSANVTPQPKDVNPKPLMSLDLFSWAEAFASTGIKLPSTWPVMPTSSLHSPVTSTTNPVHINNLLNQRRGRNSRRKKSRIKLEKRRLAESKVAAEAKLCPVVKQEKISDEIPKESTSTLLNFNGRNDFNIAMKEEYPSTIKNQTQITYPNNQPSNFIPGFPKCGN